MVRDAIGNAVDSGWSSSYMVAPPLVVSLLSPDPVSPQAAGMAKVRWKVDATGGVGERTIEFRTTDGKEEKREQERYVAHVGLVTADPGTYRVKAVVRDAIGNAVDSGWSPEYRGGPEIEDIVRFPGQASPAGGGGFHGALGGERHGRR